MAKVTATPPTNPFVRLLLAFADTQAWNIMSNYFGPMDQFIANTLKKLATLEGSPGGARITQVERKIACDVGHNMVLWAPDIADEINKFPFFAWLTIDENLVQSISSAGVQLLEFSGAGGSVVHYQGLWTPDPVPEPVPEPVL